MAGRWMRAGVIFLVWGMGWENIAASRGDKKVQLLKSKVNKQRKKQHFWLWFGALKVTLMKQVHTHPHTDTQDKHTHTQFESSLPEIEAAEQDEWLFSSIKHPLNETHWVVCVCVRVWYEFKLTVIKPGGRRWQSCRAFSVSSDWQSTTSNSMSLVTSSPSTLPVLTLLPMPLLATSHSMADTAHAKNKSTNIWSFAPTIDAHTVRKLVWSIVRRFASYQNISKCLDTGQSLVIGPVDEILIRRI